MPNPDTSEHSPAISSAITIFTENGGILRMRNALKLGIHRNSLYKMLELNIIERISRGLYRLSNAEPLGNPDLVTVSQRIPSGVVCLVSALAFHNLSTQIPHEVYVAIPRDSRPPRLDYPPIRFFRFGKKAYAEGIEQQELDGIQIPIYCREKTIADCFKFRNEMGLDTVLEAIQFYSSQPHRDVELLLHYSAICRVQNTIRPYLEAIL